MSIHPQSLFFGTAEFQGLPPKRFLQIFFSGQFFGNNKNLHSFNNQAVPHFLDNIGNYGVTRQQHSPPRYKIA